MFTRDDRAHRRARSAGAALLAIACAMLLGGAPAFASTTVLAGTDLAGDHVSSADPGHAEVYQTTAGDSGTVSSLSLYLDGGSTASGLELGLYADSEGRPSTLLTSGRLDAPAAGWNAVPVPDAHVEAGHSYWLALLDPADATGTLVWRDRAGGSAGGAEQTSGSVDLQTLPDVWFTGGVYSDGPVSEYAGGTPGAPSAPTLEATPSALSFWATRNGGNPAAKTIAIANGGGGSLSYSVSDDAAWLTESPSSGTAPGSVKVAVNTAGLAAGTYTATVTITGAGADGSPRALPVTLTVNPARTDSGLVGAWSFDETSGPTANDSSGHRNAGAITGAAHSTGIYGGGLSFNGAGDWVTVGDSSSLDLTSGLTLEAWVRPDTLGAAWRTVLIKEQDNALAYALYGNTDAGRPSANVFTDSEHGIGGPAPLPTGEWSHLATTWDGTTLRLFVNGTEVAGQPLSGTAVRSSGALRIGGNAIWGEWFSGQIDEVRVYNRALSGAEVAADRDTPIAAAPSGSGSGLTAAQKLKALLQWLAARWRVHHGQWVRHGRYAWFRY